MKAHEKMEKRIKVEVAALKEKQKEQIAQMYSFDRALPEVEHLIEPVEVHDLEDHVVTISSMDTVAMASKVRYGMTRNELQKKDEEPDDEEEQEADEANEASPSKDIDLQITGDSVKSVKKALTKQVVKSVKKLKVFQKKMKLENSKNSKKSRSKSKRQEKSKKKLGKRRNRPSSRPPQR